MNYGLIFFALLSGVILPAYALVTAKKTQTYLQDNPQLLVQTYKSILVMQWGMCLPVLIILGLQEGGFISIGLHFLTNPLSVLGLIVATFTGYHLVRLLPYPEKRLIKAKKRLKEVMYIVPKNEREYKWSVLLSITAGICEEILFRGLFYEFLLAYITPVYAILLVNIMFGLGHAGTRFKNMIQTMGLGLLWSVTYYFTDSLWAPILMHILVDFYSLRLGYRVNQYDQQLAEKADRQPEVVQN